MDYPLFGRQQPIHTTESFVAEISAVAAILIAQIQFLCFRTPNSFTLTRAYVLDGNRIILGDKRVFLVY
jgi:hypothetical protein